VGNGAPIYIEETMRRPRRAALIASLEVDDFQYGQETRKTSNGESVSGRFVRFAADPLPAVPEVKVRELQREVDEWAKATNQ